jgi:rubrerythrin
MEGAALSAAIAVRTAPTLKTVETADLIPASTTGDRRPEPILRAAADSEAAARDTFDRWADDEAHDRVQRAFERVADQERDHYARLTAFLDDHEEPSAPGPLHASLRGRRGTIERVAAGMIGRVVVSQRVQGGLVECLDRQGEREMADCVRDLRDETMAVRETGETLLDRCCSSADDWHLARAAAEYTVTVAAEAAVDADPG